MWMSSLNNECNCGPAVCGLGREGSGGAGSGPGLFRQQRIIYSVDVIRSGLGEKGACSNRSVFPLGAALPRAFGRGLVAGSRQVSRDRLSHPLPLIAVCVWGGEEGDRKHTAPVSLTPVALKWRQRHKHPSPAPVVRVPGQLRTGVPGDVTFLRRWVGVTQRVHPLAVGFAEQGRNCVNGGVTIGTPRTVAEETGSLSGEIGPAFSVFRLPRTWSVPCHL